MEDQLICKGITNCPAFVPNSFKRMRCRNCGNDLRDHMGSAVKVEDMVFGIAEEQGKLGGHIILSPEKCYTSQLGSLHLGGYTSSTKTYIQTHKITHIVNTAGGLEKFFVKWGNELPALEKEFGVQFLRLGWTDTANQKLYREKHWDDLIESIIWIDNARKKGNVVVHCAQGKSRSATLVVAYLMAKKDMTRDEALIFVKKIRPIAEPNDNFLSQLASFESSTELSLLREALRNECS
eukprot:TRINITY_DN2284_c0_g1_i1.p1 TRINITY_DN2284_c0_g1~~TRINITY_DN2284_c0_g1_i1.p1  ORF type:complete len:237 (-),score=42.53 TRINITY_DN2284_c0_g1_i1:185-895(-)